MNFLLNNPIMNFIRAIAADSFIRLGYAIAPSHYLEQMLGIQPDE